MRSPKVQEMVTIGKNEFAPSAKVALYSEAEIHV